MTRLLEPTHASVMNVHQRRVLGGSVLLRVLLATFVTGYWLGDDRGWPWTALGTALALWSLRDLLRDYAPTDRQEPTP